MLPITLLDVVQPCIDAICSSRLSSIDDDDDDDGGGGGGGDDNDDNSDCCVEDGCCEDSVVEHFGAGNVKPLDVRGRERVVLKYEFCS